MSPHFGCNAEACRGDWMAQPDHRHRHARGDGYLGATAVVEGPRERAAGTRTLGLVRLSPNADHLALWASQDGRLNADEEPLNAASRPRAFDAFVAPVAPGDSVGRPGAT